MDNKHSRFALSMMGERPEFHDWVAGEIVVERVGRKNPVFLLRQNDLILAKLEWPRLRFGKYEAADGRIRLDLSVSQMGRLLVAKDEMSRMSKLNVKRTSLPRRAKMVICLSDADCFMVQQRVDGANRQNFSLHVSKAHYVSELFKIEFVRSELQKNQRESASRVVARITINRVMRWEARHFHHLMALLVGRVVFVGGHDQFKFDTRRNNYFHGHGLVTIRHGRKIQPRPPRR